MCASPQNEAQSVTCAFRSEIEKHSKNRTLVRSLRSTLVAKKPPGTLNRSHRSSDKTSCRFVWAAYAQIMHSKVELGHEGFERRRRRRRWRLRDHSVLDDGLSAARAS